MKLHESILIIKNQWNWFFENNNDTHTTTLSKKDHKLAFFADVFIGLTTYDYNLSITLGKECLEVLKVIMESRHSDYFKEVEGNQERYIRTCNYFINLLDWGGSLRHAWIDNVNNSVVLSSFGEYTVDSTEEFLKWFLYEFMESEE